MKIVRIKLYIVNVPERKWWWSDDFYGQPEHQRSEHGIAEVETSEGLTGLTQIGRATPMATMEAALNEWLGQDVLKVNLADSTAPMVSAFEQAILDLRGQALGGSDLEFAWRADSGIVSMLRNVPATRHRSTQQRTHSGVGNTVFAPYKMKCITSRETTPEERIRYVVDRVEAIHKVLPDMAVRPDIRWRLEEVWVAQELAHRLQGHRMDSLESPITKRAAGAFGGTFSEWRRLRQDHPPTGRRPCL